MGIQEKINEKPALFAGTAIAVIVVAIVVSIVYWRSGKSGGNLVPVTKIFFTEDDGQSYFPAPYERLAEDFKGPLGKPAVRAHVFQHRGEKPVVGWMETYTADGKRLLAQYYSDPARKGTAPPETLELEKQRMVKRPGAGAWLSALAGGEATQIPIMARKNGETPVQLAPE
ncbi:MAG: hypothetical protein ABSH20_27485 [Tepidisphaeraceae bacterium]|jgi:hypothetical protein